MRPRGLLYLYPDAPRGMGEPLINSFHSYILGGRHWAEGTEIQDTGGDITLQVRERSAREVTRATWCLRESCAGWGFLEG